jgi:hypothetical protein
MKSSEIHNGLPEKELRNYFANALSETFDKNMTNQKVEIPYDKNHPFDWSIKNDEAEIARLKRNIEITYQKIALISLIKERGWEEHDISDYTTNDTNHKLWFSFIGTKEEYDELMVKLEIEKENL